MAHCKSKSGRDPDALTVTINAIPRKEPQAIDQETETQSLGECAPRKYT